MEKEDKKIKADTVTPAMDQKKKRKGGKFFKLVFLIILIALGYSQYQLYILKNPEYQQKLQADKNQLMIKKAGELMLLPPGNPQQVLYVQDAATLKKQQPFFKDAENEDAVLIYKDIAIIYSQSRNKIVNVGPIVADNQAVQQEVTAPKVETTAKATTTKR